MPPQPLSKVHLRTVALPGPETLYTHRPALAPLAMAVIAHWSEIEAKAAGMLAFVLHAEAGPVMAMLQSMRAASAQMDAITAAGSTKLAGKELETFLAVMRMVRVAAKKRNPIAHHVWAFSMDMVDAVLLVEPTAYVEMYVKLAESDAPAASIDTKRAMVYRARDFTEIIDEMNAIARCLDLATFFLNGKHPVSPETYARLSAEPLFQEALKWLKSSRSRPAE